MTNSDHEKYASISIDLDNLWSYLKVHGDSGWEQYPSYFDIFLPRFFDILNQHELKATFFVVGQDAARKESQHWIKKIAEEGHELGNHSFNHEPWFQELSSEEIMNELRATHRAIETASGKAPIGFRGPGFCCNPKILEAAQQLGYLFDSSLLPTVITPLARLYYLARAGSLNKEDRAKRKSLFGPLKNGFMPIKPFEWKLTSGSMLEIPVTTVPLLRIPFHISYVMWLSKFSKKGALWYFNAAIMLCKSMNVAPTILFHPLDFLGKEDVAELAFFPGMDLSREHKLEIVNSVFSKLKMEFDVMPMSQHAKRILDKSPPRGKK